MCGGELCDKCQEFGRDGNMANVSRSYHDNKQTYICVVCGFVQVIGPKKRGDKEDDLLYSGFISLKKLREEFKLKVK